MRFLFYSHDGVGLGHVRRNLAIAAGVVRAQPSASVLIATSVDEVCQLGLPPHVDTLKIPGVKKLSNSEYGSRRLAMSGPDMHALRSALLLETARSFQPDVLVVDKHPLGAGGELLPAIEQVRAAGGRIVLGLRDILDDPDEVRREWEREHINERIVDYYDKVLVYGSEAIFDTVREYRLTDAVAERTSYCGYVVNKFDCAWQSQKCPHALVNDERRHPVVLGTTGGGEDGYQILDSFVHAAGAEPWNSVAVAGPLLPKPGLQSLQRLAAEQNVTMHTFIPCLSNLFRTADALVCMGGYNTLTEAAACGVPAVCIPRTKPRTEQLIRARAFERLGLVRTLRPEDLSVAALRREVNAALEMPRSEMLRRAGTSLHFDGVNQAATHLVAMAASTNQVSRGLLN